jgi:hypothetical protein
MQAQVYFTIAEHSKRQVEVGTAVPTPTANASNTGIRVMRDSGKWGQLSNLNKSYRI